MSRNRPLLVTREGERVSPHILIAEKAVGGRLPKGTEVHHVDENPFNNSPDNLVICPSAAYHKLLHQRQRAFDACGNYGWRKCQFCKAYDAPENMRCTRKNATHRACEAAHKVAGRGGLKPRVIGEAHYLAIFTDEQVLAIRKDSRTQQSIADAYGVSRGTICDIRRGVTWKHLLPQVKKETRDV